MIGTSALLASLTFGAFFILYIKLPRFMRRLIVKFPLLSDALACLGSYMLLGRTLTALIASGMLAILISAALWFGKGELETNESVEVQAS